MADYAVIGNVESELKGFVFSASTTPTSTDVTRFITEASKLMDSYIGARYETPANASGSADLLRMICVGLVAPRVRNIVGIKTGTPEVNQGGKALDPLKPHMEMLKEIAKGSVELPGATLISSTGGVDSFNVDEGVEHTFERDTDQW